MIGHGKTHRIYVAAQRDLDGWIHRIVASIFDGIVQEIEDSLADQFAVACTMISGSMAVTRAKPCILANGSIELGAVGGNGERSTEVISAAIDPASTRENKNHQMRVEGADQLIGFTDNAFKRDFSGFLAIHGQRIGRLVAQRVNGVFRSCAILSETCFSPSFSFSMRPSMAFNDSDRRSNSSPERPNRQAFETDHPP